MPEAYPLNDNGQPEMRHSLVLMMDILGYKEIAQNASQSVLNDLWETLQNARIAFPKDNHLSYKTKIFTDNIIVSCPIPPSDDGEMKLGRFLLATAEYQTKMAVRGYFVRGGISLGLHYMDEDTAFGPALIEAYKIESKVAIHPRVVLSEEVVKMVHKHRKYYYPPDESPHNYIILIDNDGRHFVNYLEGDLGNFDDEHAGYEQLSDVLKEHKNRIEEELRHHVENRYVWDKYVWTSRYHNHVANKLFPKDESLLISEAVITLPFRSL